MGRGKFQSRISDHRGAVATASPGDQAPILLGVLRAIVIALSFWVGVGYLVLLLG